MNFKVDFIMNDRPFTQRFFATTLEDLFNQIQDKYPKAKIVTIIGS